MTPVISNSRSVERALIEASLRAVPKGEVITYEDLSLAALCEIKTIWSLVGRVRDEISVDGFVFDPVKNVGLKRLTDAEISVGVSLSRRQKIHRQAKRGSRELAGITDVASLSEFERGSALVGRSLFGAICAVTTRNAVAAIAENVARTGMALPVGAAIEAFRDIK